MRREAARAWLLGLAAGVLGGILSISWILPLFGVGFLPLVVGCLARPRPFGASGTLVAWGGTWALLFRRADAACDPASCVGPDITPWLLASGALVALGIALLALGLRRTRPAS